MRPLTRLFTTLLILALPALAGCRQPAVDPAQEVQARLDDLATQLTTAMRVDDLDGLNWSLNAKYEMIGSFLPVTIFWRVFITWALAPVLVA